MEIVRKENAINALVDSEKKIYFIYEKNAFIFSILNYSCQINEIITINQNHHFLKEKKRDVNDHKNEK